MNILVTPEKPITTPKQSRNLGLDIVRSMAILMVLVSHTRYSFIQSDLQGLSIFGLLGVELFFVLSGFLIGKIIITEVLTNSNWQSLRRFYLRRWFRTLPPYFLVLGFLIIVAGRPFHWQNLFFLQNFNNEQLNIFAVSWSLSIEEWFYLITPFGLLVFISKLFKNNKKAFWIYCGLVIIFSVAARTVVTVTTNPTWDFDIRKQIFLRQDSLIIGVALAGFKFYHRNLYLRIASYTWQILLVAIAGFVGVGYYYIYVLKAGYAIDSSFTARVFLFPGISILVALLIISLEQNVFLNNLLYTAKTRHFFAYVSQISYSLYLVHYDLLAYSREANKSANNLGVTLLWCSGAILGSFILATLLFKFYEEPILRLRDRFKFSR